MIIDTPFDSDEASPVSARRIGSVIEWSPPIETGRVPAAAITSNARSMSSDARSPLFMCGSGVSPRSLIRCSSHGSSPNAVCTRR